MSRFKSRWFSACSAALAIAACVVAPAYSSAQALNSKDPQTVLLRYLRATQARDYFESYRYISAKDRSVKDVNKYARQRGAIGGFVLEAKKKLAAFSEIKIAQKQVSPDRIQAVAKIRVPEPNSISSLMLDWDLGRLDSLGPRGRAQILESLEKRKRDGTMELINAADEMLALVKEGDEWRIFLNWAAGVKVPLRLSLSQIPDLDVALSKKEVVVQPGELFEISLRIKNLSNRTVVTSIAHVIEPQKASNFLDLVECGFIKPVTLEAGKERSFDARYLVMESIPEGIHQLNVTYDFKPLQRSR